MPANYCGLISVGPNPRPPVPLKSIMVHANVRGWTTAVTAELEYQNGLSEPIECQFVFPLADSTAIYRVEADINGQKLVAECRSRQQAEKAYRDAVDSGQAGVLLESQEDSPDVFRIMLGNLPAEGSAKITIGYVQPVDRDADGTLTVMLPSVLNPRYVPEHMISDPEKMKEHFHFKVPYVPVSLVAYSMSFSATVTLGLNAVISQVKAANEADKVNVNFENDQQTANVSLDGDFTQDHDFGLCIMPAEPFKPMVFVEPGLPVSGEKTWLNCDVATAWFEPQTAKDVVPGAGLDGDEYWLVIDRSGSMRGSKINDAKAALVLFVKSLPIGCKFNVIGFGSGFTALFADGSVNYSEETIKEAIDHANLLDAHMGGTDILSPLRYIYGQRKPSGLGSRKFVILLTDGEVGNTGEVINLARENASTTRVFSIGIGEGASTALVNGLARVSGGLSEFVRSAKDRLQAKVIALMKAATNPAAEDIKMMWEVSGGKVVSLMPDQVPTAAYQGRPIMQYALFERFLCNNVDGTACLTAKVGKDSITHSFTFAVPSSVNSPAGDAMPLHRLAAKAKLQELTDNPDYLNREEWRKNLVALSTATSVLCQETAFVAVDAESKEEVKDAKGRPRFIDIERPTSYFTNQSLGPLMSFRQQSCLVAHPQCLTEFPMSRQHSNALSSPRKRRMALRLPLPPPPGQYQSSGLTLVEQSSIASLPQGYYSQQQQQYSSFARVVPSSAQAPMPMQPRTYPTTASLPLPPRGHYPQHQFQPEQALYPPFLSGTDGMDRLARLQNFNGSWPLTNEVTSTISTGDVADVRMKASAAAFGGQVGDDSVIATFIALAVLRFKFGPRRDEWELIEQKAIAFLRNSMPPWTQQLSDLVEAIAKAFSLSGAPSGKFYV